MSSEEPPPQPTVIRDTEVTDAPTTPEMAKPHDRQRQDEGDGPDDEDEQAGQRDREPVGHAAQSTGRKAR